MAADARACSTSLNIGLFDDVAAEIRTNFAPMRITLTCSTGTVQRSNHKPRPTSMLLPNSNGFFTHLRREGITEAATEGDVQIISENDHPAKSERNRNSDGSKKISTQNRTSVRIWYSSKCNETWWVMFRF